MLHEIHWIYPMNIYVHHHRWNCSTHSFCMADEAASLLMWKDVHWGKSSSRFRKAQRDSQIVNYNLESHQNYPHLPKRRFIWLKSSICHAWQYVAHILYMYDVPLSKTPIFVWIQNAEFPNQTTLFSLLSWQAAINGGYWLVGWIILNARFFLKKENENRLTIFKLWNSLF